MKNFTFDELINNNEVQNIGYKAALKFKKQLNKEEIDSCFMIALWKACETYNPDYDKEKIASFYTYFYKGVLFECMKLLKVNNSYIENIKKVKSSNNSNKIKDIYNQRDFADFEIFDLFPNKNDHDLIFKRFWENKTLKEISKEYNVSAQSIKKRLTKILNTVKKSSV